MDCRLLTGNRFDLSDYRFGAPQRAGLLTVVPLTAPRAVSGFLALTDARIVGNRARNGSSVLENASETDCLLAPLHFGMWVDRRDSRLLTSATLTPPGKRIDFVANYCLPLSLRGAVWRDRSSANSIGLLTHLDDLHGWMRRLGLGTPAAAVRARSPELNRFVKGFELLTGQTGALFFLGDRPVGLEIAPSPAYFAATWQPLVSGCYGLTALLHGTDSPAPVSIPKPYDVSAFSELRTEMFRVRHQRQEQLEAAVAGPPEGDFKVEEMQRWRNYRVRSLTGPTFAGQVVEEVAADEPGIGGVGTVPRMLRSLFRKETATAEEPPRRVVYASIFALDVSNG